MNLKPMLGFLFALNLSICSSVQGNTLLIESNGRKVVYKLDGASVPTNKLLDLAADMLKREPQRSVRIIFDSQLPLDVAFNAIGVFDKAGFQKIDLFALSTQTEKMCKITIGLPEIFDERSRK